MRAVPVIRGTPRVHKTPSFVSLCRNTEGVFGKKVEREEEVDKLQVCGAWVPRSDATARRLVSKRSVVRPALVIFDLGAV
jgi:hypothetical protein